MALISNIQHFNVHDGNGFRTTVFFQGCGLKCKWCHNPEMIDVSPVMMFNPRLCSMCGACVETCEEKALVIENNTILYNKNKCKKCMKCESVCFFRARRFSSHEMRVEDVLLECLKERDFYRYHRGGVTLSGGEPLLQAEFCCELMRSLKNEKILTNIETAGYIPFDKLELVADLTDVFLYDLKLISEKKRKKWLGTEDDLMLKNLVRLSEIHNRIVIRIPLIPGVNDNEEECCSILDFMSSLRGIKFVHILPFHQLGVSKYSSSNIPYEMGNTVENNEDAIEKFKNLVLGRGYNVSVGGNAFAYE